MICQNCQTFNEMENVFCVNCGGSVSQTATLPPTQFFATPSAQQYQQPLRSEETAVLPVNQFDPSMANFTPSLPFAATGQTGKNKKMFLLIGTAAGLFLMIGLGVLFVLTRSSSSVEILPEHLGMFIQSPDKDKVREVRKQDFTNAVEGADKLLKDDGLLVTEENPNLILYSDGKDVPLNDLRLIRLDTIKSDGNLKQLDFQAAPVENKPEMKRIRVPGGIANGKYAFALLDGHLDDGKHKFWAFEVKNSGKSSSDSDLKSTTVSLKPKEKKDTTTTTTTTQPAAPTTPPPTGTYAFCIGNNVVLRSSPSLTASKLDGLYKGQRLYVMSISQNTSTWGGKTGYWANVQTDYGTTGWVFAPLIR